MLFNLCQTNVQQSRTQKQTAPLSPTLWSPKRPYVYSQSVFDDGAVDMPSQSFATWHAKTAKLSWWTTVRQFFTHSTWILTAKKHLDNNINMAVEAVVVAVCLWRNWTEQINKHSYISTGKFLYYPITSHFLSVHLYFTRVHSTVWGTALQTGRSWVWFPMDLYHSTVLIRVFESSAVTLWILYDTRTA